MKDREKRERIEKKLKKTVLCVNEILFQYEKEKFLKLRCIEECIIGIERKGEKNLLYVRLKGKK